MTPPPLLSVSGVSAGYGRTPVLADLSFAMTDGTWLGLLGANGSGKSTLLRAIAGLLPPRAGRILLDGRDAAADPTGAKAAIGYAVDPAELPFALSGLQYLDLVASARGMRAPEWRLGDLPEALGVAAWRNAPLGTCSLGIRTRFALCAALVGAPRLLILDETLNGLDPLGSWQARRLVAEQVRLTGCGVILATHALEVVAATCDRALFLDDGAIAHSWSAAGLRRAREDGRGFEDEVMGALRERQVRAAAARFDA